MSSNIPPKPRTTPRQAFYTAGQIEESPKPTRFRTHISEPDTAATLLQRNSNNSDDHSTKISSSFANPNNYTPGLYSGKYNPSKAEKSFLFPAYSLTEAKIIKSKEYAKQSVRPSSICAKTISKDEFKKKSVGRRNSVGVTVDENWLYRTRMKPVERDMDKEALDPSENCPEWFKVKENPMVKNHDIAKSQGFDGTVTVLSRITGWITVSPKSRNRQKRLGRYGPFDKNKKDINYQNVSDLAPAWMHTEFPRKNDNDHVNTVPHPCLRKELKRVLVIEKDQPQRSVFSIGDFRHNVVTSEEAVKYAQNVSDKPCRLIEWKEDVSKQKFDKPVTGKIGSLY